MKITTALSRTLAFVMPVLAATTALAGHPFRGSIPLSVVLCQYQGNVASTRSPDFFSSMITRAGTNGVNDFWSTTSYGAVNLNTTMIKGWYQVPYSAEQAQTLTRTQRFHDCLEAARTARVDAFTPPSGHMVAVITSPDLDAFSIKGTGAFFPASVDIGALAFEIGHELGLNHSFSDDPKYRNSDWAQIGEYDDQWDLMSYANTFGTRTAKFGISAPTLNAYNRDRMGWIPQNRILTFGADGAREGEITLAPLNRSEQSGYLLVRVPFDANDPNHYYTIEYRERDGWDAGFPRDAVLVHEVRVNDKGQYISYLLRERGGSRDPIQGLEQNGIMIAVDSTGSGQARIRVTSQTPDMCLKGYVWREASRRDRVCVTPKVREQTKTDNRLARSRRGQRGSTGPDACLQGYVWREAFPNDHVCVTPESRQQAELDNEQSLTRRNPARLTHGPNTCQKGYVWREADLTDWVCVTAEVRARVAEENRLASGRKDPSTDTCLEGYVWREAFPGDRVCVTPESRKQVEADNADAWNRLIVQ